MKYNPLKQAQDARAPNVANMVKEWTAEDVKDMLSGYGVARELANERNEQERVSVYTELISQILEAKKIMEAKS